MLPGIAHSMHGGVVIRTLGSKLSVASYIGDMTGGGGLAVAFDSTTSGARTGGVAIRATNNEGYVGANLSAAPKRVFQSISYGSSNHGYIQTDNPSTTLELYAKASAPASSTDGTLLGSLVITDTSNESGNPRTITSSDTSTLWAYVWLRISFTGTARDVCCAELELYEAV